MSRLSDNIFFRLPPDLKNAFLEICHLNHTTMSAELNRLLRRYMAEIREKAKEEEDFRSFMAWLGSLET